MKKLLSIALIVTLCISTAFSQTSAGKAAMKSTPTHADTDTAVNTTAKTQKLFITGNATNTIMSFQCDLTTISGTPAGVIRLLGSNTGSKYARILPTDSLIVDANHLSKIFVVTNPIYTDYAIQYTPSGSVSMKMNSVAVWRKTK